MSTIIKAGVLFFLGVGETGDGTGSAIGATGAEGAGAGTGSTAGVGAAGDSILVPQLRQNFEVSKSFAPQFLQNILSPPIYVNHSIIILL